MNDYLIVALTWLGVGIFITALAVSIRADKEYLKLLQRLEDIIKRNNEVLDQNKKLITFNNYILEQIKDIRDGLKYLNDIFRN